MLLLFLQLYMPAVSWCGWVGAQQIEMIEIVLSVGSSHLFVNVLGNWSRYKCTHVVAFMLECLTNTQSCHHPPLGLQVRAQGAPGSGGLVCAEEA